MTFLGTDRRVLALALARMADALGNSFLIVVLPAYIASQQVSLVGLEGTAVLGVTLTAELLIGIVLSLFGFLNSFLQPVTGRLSDRTGRRRAFILAGLALLGISSGAYTLVSDYYLVLVLRALQGIGAALTIPATVALVNELATTEDRGGNFGVFNTFRLIGFGFGPFVAGAVVEFVSYAAAFWVAVAGAFVSFGLVTLLVSDPEETAAAAGDDLEVEVTGDDRLLDPVFALGVATMFMAIGLALFATLRTPINTRLGQGDFLFGVEFGAAVLANVLFQVPIGRASDRYGRRPFIVFGFLILGPAVLAQGYVTSAAGMITARLVQGVSVAMVFAPALALAGDLAGEGESGTKLSMLTMAFGLGVAIGPLASGFLVGYGFVYPFALGSVLAVLGLGLVYSQVHDTVGGSVARGAVPED